MDSGSILGTILVGLVVGALGRLVVPGRQPIGCLLTLLIGVVGAAGGLAIANSADIGSWLLVLAIQVGVAAVGVAVVAGAMRGPRWRPPRLH